ncbi:MAG: hypothetical protein HKN21_15205 [Candidatus Eisenbacteria bacterium]|uniref:DUF5683 domain-containing protein n=1 Tax=Eiseniibacteriota bacterium TaxID=2212470 RepID=A0A7Y2EBP0_UNCEI|nr:hypothetical protein [Candidatus Eisenbacteria bacterium]
MKTLLLAVGLCFAAASAEAMVPELHPEVQTERPGLSQSAVPEARTSLAFQAQSESSGSADGPSPFLAGLMSAVVPGSGQLALGKKRGLVYLGLETVSIFAVWALRASGNQAEEDYQNFADTHWQTDLYETVSECGDGLGPSDFEREREALFSLRDSSPDAYYDDIGDLGIYACGWDLQTNRSEYNAMRSRSDDLFRSARAFTTVIFFNHIVSAIDAAKSASNLRQAEAVNLDVTTPHFGEVAVKVSLNREF